MLRPGSRLGVKVYAVRTEEQRLTIEEFNSTYEVVKKEKPAIVIGDI